MLLNRWPFFICFIAGFTFSDCCTNCFDFFSNKTNGGRIGMLFDVLKWSALKRFKGHLNSCSIQSWVSIYHQHVMNKRNWHRIKHTWAVPRLTVRCWIKQKSRQKYSVVERQNLIQNAVSAILPLIKRELRWQHFMMKQ